MDPDDLYDVYCYVEEMEGMNNKTCFNIPILDFLIQFDIDISEVKNYKNNALTIINLKLFDKDPLNAVFVQSWKNLCNILQLKKM